MSGATAQPSTLPATVHVGLDEEFPNPWRLAKLEQVDFPVSLAVAAPSRDAFLQLRESIQRDYPQVRTVFFWPLLRAEEGYYPGPLSDPAAVRRVIAETADVPVLWDLELPPGMSIFRGRCALCRKTVPQPQRGCGHGHSPCMSGAVTRSSG
jgi:hypothetical protein